MPAAAALDALGDPTRRAILELLTDGPQAVGALADRMPVSRPAVSQHLRVLRTAELVSETAAGTRRLYRINPAGLRTVHAYLDRFWSIALDGFVELAVQEAAASAGLDAGDDAADQLAADPESPGPRSERTES